MRRIGGEWARVSVVRAGACHTRRVGWKRSRRRCTQSCVFAKRRCHCFGGALFVPSCTRLLSFRYVDLYASVLILCCTRFVEINLFACVGDVYSSEIWLSRAKTALESGDEALTSIIPLTAVKTLQLVITDKRDTGVKLTMAIGTIAIVAGLIALYYKK